jgi:hypothetical protein
MPAGRPTDYRPEFCERVIELGREGASLAQMGAELGVLRETLNEWAKVNPEFSVALSQAKQHSQAWWEDQGRKGIWAGKSFNAAAWAKSVSCRFPDDYRERQDVHHTAGAGVAGAIVAARQRVGG